MTIRASTTNPANPASPSHPTINYAITRLPDYPIDGQESLCLS